MISLSCTDSSSSICAMRALIMASVSGAIVTVPLRISDTTMRSRSPASVDSVTLPCWDWISISDIGRSRGDLRPQLSHRVSIVDRLLQDLLELVVALQLAAEVG